MHPNSTLTSSEATTHLRRALQALPHPSDDGTNSRRGRVDHFLPAIWVPDAKTESCMRCGARFGWRRRRHHCRLCGRCVCASCSGKVRHGWMPLALTDMCAQTFLISDVNTKASKPARACNACYETVFPLLGSPVPPHSQGESQNSYTSTLGTLSQLPSWKSMPSFAPPSPGWTLSSALLKAPPSAFHEPRRGSRMGPRPQSQPVMDSSLSQMTSATASSVSVDLNSPTSDSMDRSPDGESRPDLNRFSAAALAVHTSPVTARPSSFGEGRSKRFSLLLGGQSVMKRSQTNEEEDRDPSVAASKLGEILGREQRV